MSAKRDGAGCPLRAQQMPTHPRLTQPGRLLPSLADTGKNRAGRLRVIRGEFPPRQPALRVRKASVWVVSYKWSARGTPGTECFLSGHPSFPPS